MSEIVRWNINIYSDNKIAATHMHRYCAKHKFHSVTFEFILNVGVKFQRMWMEIIAVFLNTTFHYFVTNWWTQMDIYDWKGTLYL
jgi:hypothetical protein